MKSAFRPTGGSVIEVEASFFARAVVVAVVFACGLAQAPWLLGRTVPAGQVVSPYVVLHRWGAIEDGQVEALVATRSALSYSRSRYLSGSPPAAGGRVLGRISGPFPQVERANWSLPGLASSRTIYALYRPLRGGIKVPAGTRWITRTTVDFGHALTAVVIPVVLIALVWLLPPLRRAALWWRDLLLSKLWPAGGGAAGGRRGFEVLPRR